MQVELSFNASCLFLSQNLMRMNVGSADTQIVVKTGRKIELEQQILAF